MDFCEFFYGPKSSIPGKFTTEKQIEASKKKKMSKKKTQSMF